MGHRLSITESVLGTDNATYHNATVSYGYDNLYRLISEHRVPANPSANNPAFWYEYQYDPAGNRLMLTQKDGAGNVIGTTGSTYDAANKLLTSGNVTYTWDANGNQTGKTVNDVTTTYVWDHEDKMTSLHDGVTMTFTTDADGFRRSLTKDGAVTYFLYDRRSNIPGLDPLIAEVNAAGNATARYVQANGLLALRHEPSAISHWYHFEALGTTRGLTDNNQSVSDTYAFEAFGSTAASAGSSPNAFGYVGKYGYYGDGQSGLRLLKERYYDPEAGRFVAEDTLRDGVNWFAYARARPSLLIDPTGERPTIDAASCGKCKERNKDLQGVNNCIETFCKALNDPVLKKKIEACERKYKISRKCLVAWCNTNNKIKCLQGPTPGGGHTYCDDVEDECPQGCRNQGKKFKRSGPCAETACKTKDPSSEIFFCCKAGTRWHAKMCPLKPGWTWPPGSSNCDKTNTHWLHEVGHFCGVKCKRKPDEVLTSWGSCVLQYINCSHD